MVTVLVVDDEANIRSTLRVALEAMGHQVAEAASIAIRLLKTTRASELRLAAPLDLRLGAESGFDLMDPGGARAVLDLAVVIITAHATLDRAVEAMRRGAFDFLPKPFTPAQVRAVLEPLERFKGPNRRLAGLEEQIRVPGARSGARESRPQAGGHPRAGAASGPDRCHGPIRGESGTGKGVLARQIHAMSRRSAGPFVTVSCPEPERRASGKRALWPRPRSVHRCGEVHRGKVAAAEGEASSSTRWVICPCRCSPSSFASCRTASTTRGRIVDANRLRALDRRDQSRP